MVAEVPDGHDLHVGGGLAAGDVSVVESLVVVDLCSQRLDLARLAAPDARRPAR
jgi:hypothetical protein